MSAPIGGRSSRRSLPYADNSDMTESWQWDETLYAGSAAHYVRGRLPYPDDLGKQIATAAGLGKRARALDVGCGPGSLTLLLAGSVDHVVGIDADPAMIAQASLAARRAGLENILWRRMRAEELPVDLGCFDLVTFAQSLHWMDRQQVLTIVREMLRPGGRCVHVHATTHRGDSTVDPLPRPRPPYDEIDALVSSYLGLTRPAGRSSGDEDSVYRQSGFDRATYFKIEGGEVVERTVEEIVAATFSLSSSTPYLLGPRQADFEADLKALLEATSQDGLFCERVPELAFDVWRSTADPR